VKVASLQLDLN